MRIVKSNRIRYLRLIDAVITPETANTQINFLGIKRADIITTKSGDVYSFSL